MDQERKRSQVKVYNNEEGGEGIKRLRITYTNIDGLLSKQLELRDYLCRIKPDVMCITETKLADIIELIGIEDCDYNIHRKDRLGKSGGGVMILTKADLKVTEVKAGPGNTEILSVVLQLKNGGKRKIIVTYIPPKTASWTTEAHGNLIDNTIRTLEEAVRSCKHVILTGDFNCKNVKWESFEADGDDTVGAKVLKLTTDNLMTQWVKQETRCRGEEEPARLDLLFTKELDVAGDVVHEVPLGKSDHEVLRMEIDEKSEENGTEDHKKERRNYYKARYRDMQDFFEKIDWTVMKQTRDIQEKYNIFLQIYNEAVMRYVPLYEIKEKGKQEWFNLRCLEAKKKKERSWRNYKRRRNNTNWEKYKQMRNDYTKVRREEEKKYEKNIIEKCKDEPKLFYRHINKKLKKKESVTAIKEDDEVYEDVKVICEILNKNFQKVFTQETDFEGSDEENNFRKLEDVKVDKVDLLRLLRSLDEKKAMGPDDVSGHILKECREQLIEPICDIISCSIETGNVPVEWKRANVVPLYKNGNRQEPLNYRPVSLTSIMCKLCEKVIKRQWVEHLEKEKIINESQFGFRQGRSCVTNLICFYSRVIDIVQERDGWADCIFLDLKKAFDKVPHKRLLWKLEYRGGLGKKMTTWMKNYLVDREMRTIVKDEKSEWRRVTSGVPQGSVLAPIMFLIYVNDMPEKVTSYMSLFADDAKLLRKITEDEDCNKLQQDLDEVYDWSRKWEMEFNNKKCHSMRMGKSKKRPVKVYKMGGTNIDTVSEEKDLGITIQDSLTPEKHVNKLFGETYRLLQNIRVAFHYLDKEMMSKIIKTLIRPRLEYAAIVWSPHRKKDIRKLERIQRIATKMVPELSNMSYEARLKELDLPTLEERRERGDLIALYKFTSGIDELDRSDLVVTEERRELRGHSKKLRKGTCLKDVKKYSFPYRSVNVWNALSKDTVEASSVHQMKERLDKSRSGDGTARA